MLSTLIIALAYLSSIHAGVVPIKNPTSGSSIPIPNVGVGLKSSYAPQSLTYSPFTDAGGCKIAGDIQSDINLIKSKNVKQIRLYGLDCSALDNSIPMSIRAGLDIMLGIWIDAGNDGQADMAKLLNWMNANRGLAGSIKSITIGNEAVLSGSRSASYMITAANNFRFKLRNLGFSQPVGIVEISGIYQNNPSLCNAVDFVGVNVHPYFNSYGNAASSGDFVNSQINLVKGICPGKEVSVTETGYPHAGNVNGAQVPSKVNQQLAIKSILDATRGMVTMFSLTDDLWKYDGPFNVEKYWGMFDCI